MNFFQSIISGLRGFNNNIFTLWTNAFLAFFVPIIIGVGIIGLDMIIPVSSTRTMAILCIAALLATGIIGTITYSGWLESLYRHQKGMAVKTGDFFAVGFQHWQPLLLGGLIVGGVTSFLAALFLPAITPAIMWASARGLDTPQIYLFTLAALIVLLLPALYLLIRWFWWAHLITIKNLAVRAALKESGRLSHLDFGTVALLVFVYVFGVISLAALVLSGSNSLALFDWRSVNDIYIITGVLQIPIIPLAFHMVFMAKFIDLSETGEILMTNFDEAALKELKNYQIAINKIGGVERIRELWMETNARKWFSSLDADLNLPNLSDQTFNREGLKNKIKEYKARSGKLSDTDIRELIVMIFAWGGMRVSDKGGKPAIATIDKYEGICRNLLENKLSPVESYKQFFEARKSGMKGIGPAYYTKLIYFLCQQEAAIMDQWAARAVNVLSGEKLIKLDNKKIVSQENDEEVYKKYLDFLGKIKIEFNMDNLSKTEQLIYSCSPRNDKRVSVSPEDRAIFSMWRQYVIAKSG